MENNEERMFTCKDMPKRCFQIFQDMRKQKKLCDVTFQVGDESISAHRIILTAIMPYFKDMVSEKCSLVGEGISIPGVELSAFKCLIEFAYTCELKINKENAIDLLSAACHLGVDEVKEACSDFLAENLEPRNVLDIKNIAHKLHCTELLNDIDSYVKQNFNIISKNNEFLTWPAVYLKDIIERSDLNVESEEHVLEAVVRWVKESPEDRISELPKLLTKVRMYQIEPRYLAQLVVREEFIRTSVPCRDLIDEAKHYNLFPDIKKHICSFPVEPRQSKADYLSGEISNESIYKFHRKIEYTVQQFDLVKEEWLTTETDSFYSGAGAAVELHNKMYYFHWGYSLQYDPAKDSYRYLNYMPTPRIQMAAAAVNDKVYIFGGLMGSCGTVNRTASNAVECFDPETNEWEEMNSMSIGRWGLSAVTLGIYIFVLGGRDMSRCFDCVDRYDSTTDKWRRMTPMLTKRYFAGAVAHNGNIYACGGKTLSEGIESVVAVSEVYSPLKNTWTCISPMSTERYYFILLSCRRKLYALGGENKNGIPMHTFDIYDPENNIWTAGASTEFSHNVSAAVVMSY